MNLWTSLAFNDKEGHATFETTVNKLLSEFSLSFHLSDPMTPMNALRKLCHDLVEISRKIRKLLTDLLMLLATNDEKGHNTFEMTTEEVK